MANQAIDRRGIPSRTARRRWTNLVAVATSVLAAGAGAEPVDLVGTWHVLVHYRDSTSARPEALRWDDRVWVIERRASRLHWTVYPIVVLGDEAGRFENLGTNRARRVVGPWEPTPAQQAILDEGPPVNPRGTKSKSLRSDGKGGWTSGGRARATSATALAYHETWKIESADERPVFVRIDSLTGARPATPAEDGLIRYRTTDVSESGDELRGEFQRDDTRAGRFRMTRTPPIRGLQQQSTPSERLREHFSDQNLGLGLRRSSAPAPDESDAAGEDDESRPSGDPEATGAR